MQWRTDLPDDWDAVPDDPPVADRGLEHTWIGDQFVVRERDGPGFVASEHPVTLPDAVERGVLDGRSADGRDERFEPHESGSR